MRRIMFLLCAVSTMLVACQTERNQIDKGGFDVNDIKYGSDLRFLIASQKGTIDIDALEHAVETKSLQSIISQVPMSNTHNVSHDERLRYLFDADGVCRMYCKENSVETLYSRDWQWSLNKNTCEFVMTDSFGNTCRAEVLYFNGEILCYKGALCGELRRLDATVLPEPESELYSVVRVVDDRTSWLSDNLVSYEVRYDDFVEDDDPRAAEVMHYASAPAEIDDEAFVDKLQTSVVWLTHEREGVKSGCCYGDAVLYSMVDGRLYYHDSAKTKLVCMSDGVCRQCFTYRYETDSEDRIVEKVYANCIWSYDAATNMLTTRYDAADDEFVWQAEVIYFGDNVAILRGDVMHTLPGGVDTGFLYVDFECRDRTKILEEYSVSYDDIINAL